MSLKSELAWTIQDYLDHNDTPPARLLGNPELTEGELMTADEVAEFIKDSIATLRILSDKASPRFETVKDAYLEDLKYLTSVGSIDEDDYNELISTDNLHILQFDPIQRRSNRQGTK